MTPSVSTGDGGRKVAGEYLVAEPLDYFHFAEGLMEVDRKQPAGRRKALLTRFECRRLVPARLVGSKWVTDSRPRQRGLIE